MAKERKIFTDKGYIKASKTGRIYRKKYSKKEIRQLQKVFFWGWLICLILYLM